MRGKLIITVAWLLWTIASHGATSTDIAVGVVSSYLNDLSILVEESDGDRAYMARKSFVSHFPDDDILLPNDLVVSGSRESYSMLRPSNYITALQNMVSNHKDYRLRHSIENKRVLQRERYGDEADKFVEVVVKKYFVGNSFHGTPTSIYLTIDVEKQHIVHISNNSYSVEAQSGNVNYEELPIYELQGLAEHAITEKDYEEAYSIYERIIKKAPDNSDAYYRLAIMNYRGHGCKQIPKRQRMKKTVEYLKISIKFGNRLAQNMLYWVT